MVVERARGESQSMSGSLQSLCWGSSAFGGIVSSYFSGSLVETYGVRYLRWFLYGCTVLSAVIIQSSHFGYNFNVSGLFLVSRLCYH
jgi:hypothetical protein